MIEQIFANSYLTAAQTWTFLILFGYIVWKIIK